MNSKIEHVALKLAEKYDAAVKLKELDTKLQLTFVNERGSLTFDIDYEYLEDDPYVENIIWSLEPGVRKVCGKDERPLLAKLLRIEEPNTTLYLANMEWFENDLRLKAQHFEFVRDLAMDIANNLQCFRRNGFPEPMLFNDNWAKAYPAACSIACLCMSLTTLPYKARLKLTDRPWEYLVIEFEYNDMKESYEFGWEVLFWGFNMEHIVDAFNTAINEKLNALHQLNKFPRVERRKYLLQLDKVEEIHAIYTRGPGFTKYFSHVGNGRWVPNRLKEDNEND